MNNDELLEQMQETVIPENHTTDFDSNIELEENTEDRGNLIDIDQNYNTSVKKDALVGANGAVLDYKDVSPLEVIKKYAEKQNIPLKEPRSNCKHCYGRGYIGRLANNGAPVPCNCIYPPEVKNAPSQLIVENRALRRSPTYKKEKEKQQRLQLLERLKLEKKIETEYQQQAGLIPAIDKKVEIESDLQN